MCSCELVVNSTQAPCFALAAYFDTGLWKYFHFVVILTLYLFIIGANLLLVLLVCVNRALHEPMYMFLCSLFVNQLYGSSALFPFLLLQILSDTHTLSASLCFLQLFCVHSYGAVEYLSLAVMSYDRYLAICSPLRYSSRMTCPLAAQLIGATWLCPCLAMAALLSLLLPLPLCGNVIHKVYCDTHSVVKLACSNNAGVNVYGLVATFSTICVSLLLILYTYVRILQVCFSGSTQTRQKAVATCSPHLASLLNFSFGACFEISQSRFNMSTVPNVMRIVLSLYFLTCQPLFNPVLYGLKMSKMRLLCKRLMSNVGGLT